MGAELTLPRRTLSVGKRKSAAQTFGASILPYRFANRAELEAAFKRMHKTDPRRSWVSQAA